MCNFYIMYYMNATLENQRKSDTCANVRVPQAVNHLPADADEPLPPNPALEDIAMGHHHHVMNNNHNDDQNASPSTAAEPEVPVFNKPVGNKRPDSPGNNVLKQDSNRKSKTNLLNERLRPQGRLSTSYNSNDNNRVFGSNFLDNVDQGGYDDYNVQGRSAYLDYPNYDYFDVMRQRNRNRLKKPVYDLYDTTNNLGFSDFSPKSSYPSLSRNRNKEFNEKYDEYANGESSGHGNGKVLSVSAKKGDYGRKGADNVVVDKTNTAVKSSSSSESKTEGKGNLQVL